MAWESFTQFPKSFTQFPHFDEHYKIEWILYQSFNLDKPEMTIDKKQIINNFQIPMNKIPICY